MLQAAEKLRIDQDESVPASSPKPMVQEFTEEDFKRLKGNYRRAAKAFLTGEGSVTSSSVYKIKGDELWFVRPRMRRDAIRQSYNRSLVMKRINGIVFGNSAEIFARRNRRDTNSRWARELNIQRDLSQIIPMIPFNLFKESKLDVMKIQVVEKGPSEDLDFGRTNREGEKILQHFTGALLFHLDDNYFLFDLDRNEVPKKQFNAWMSKLPRACTSIADGYASLKPKEVSDAERFLNQECPRQGEWFFIPVQGEFTPDEDRATVSRGYGVDREYVVSLQANGNRAHLISSMSKEGYVKGLVTHEGYEHKPIELKTWHKPVPNTAVQSFKISGRVD